MRFRTFSRLVIALTALVVFFGMADTAYGLSFQTLFQHTGNTDPKTEGWTASEHVVGEFGPITNDLGSGFDAWFTDDNSSTASSGASYRQVPSASQIAQASALGWILRTRMRVVDIPDAFGLSNFVLYRNGSEDWFMSFYSQADGDPIVTTGTTSGLMTFIFEGGGSGYHLYELVFDATAGSADLFVDGAERLSNLVAPAIGITRVNWGNGDTADTGQGNYNLVQFQIATPEPATLLLLGSGLFGLGFVRRRRKM